MPVHLLTLGLPRYYSSLWKSRAKLHSGFVVECDRNHAPSPVLCSQCLNSSYELRFTCIPRISFRMKFLRSKPLSRAHLFIPISRILFFTSSLAITRDDLPYSVAANSKTLISSPSSHLRSVSFPT